MLHEHIRLISTSDDEPRVVGSVQAWLLPEVAQERAVRLIWTTDLIHLHLLVLLLVLLLVAWWAALPATWRQRVIGPVSGGALVFALLIWLSGSISLLELPPLSPPQSGLVIMAVLLALPLRPYWWASLRVQRRVLQVGLVLHALPLLWLIADDMLFDGLRQPETMIDRSLVYVTLAIWLLGLYVALVLGLHQLVTARRAPQWLDHFCATGWYADRAVVRAASIELSQAHALSEVVERLHDIARRLNFQAGILLGPNGHALVPLWSFGLPLSDVRQWQLPASGLVAQYLAAVSSPQQREQLLEITARSSAALQPGERLLLDVDRLQLWLPLVSHGVVQGVLLVGAAQRAPLLRAEDEAILLPLLGQAAAATENVTLTESLWARQVEIELLHSEVTSAHDRLLQQSELDRLRLAQDLHDGVLQQLIGVHYLLSSMPGAAPCGATIAAASERDAPHALHELQAAVGQVRGLIRELRPAGLEEFGLPIALDGYIARLRHERAGQSPLFTLDLEHNCRALPRPAGLCLFRVAQEALRNSLKHAHATTITISLRTLADDVVLTIHDDGRGFRVPSPLSQLVQADHFGLAGMAERVGWAGGSLEIHSEPGLGTTTVVRVPLSMEHEHATAYPRPAGGRSPLDPHWYAHDLEYDA